MSGLVLKEKVAVITGGNRGIGFAIANKLAAEGCSLALIARSQNELEASADEIKKSWKASVMTLPIDISNEQQVQKAISSTREAFGKIDILINGAGMIGPIGPLSEIKSDEWQRTLDTNLNGTFYCIKAVLPEMLKRRFGRILNFSGGGALLPNPFIDAYSVSKAAIVRLTENLSLELKQTGVTVCAISPGAINTKMFEETLAGGKNKLPKEIWDLLEARKKTGGDSIEAAASLALFLVSGSNAEVVNGRVISAKYDEWHRHTEHAKEIGTTDIFTMRRIVPRDRGFDWQ
ncbi:MAG: SDR family oxidoreductase [Deltaproteobacteria bacterium]|nr:SDR family oxidoreductase [Deltaproteobacteria bacterium]